MPRDGSGRDGPGTLDQPLYFFHLAKTAGGSLSRLLEDAFPVGSRFPGAFVDDFQSSARTSRERYPLLCGHFGRLPMETMQKQLAVVTLLREPGARAWSHYRALRFDHPQVSTSFREGRVTFHDYIEDPTYGATARNFQAKWLALTPTRDLRSPTAPGLALAEPFGPGSPPFDDRELEEGAFRTLDACALVGTTERLPEFVDALGRLLGRWLPMPPTINVTSQNDAPPAGTFDFVRAHSRIDVELHEHAGALLDHALATLPPVPPITDDPVSPLPYELSMADALIGTGWYQRLYTNEASWHRWTGPSTRSIIRVPVRLAGPACLDLSVVAACAPGVVEALRLTVQDRPVQPVVREHRRGVDVTADVDLDANQPVVVELEVPEVRRLAEGVNASGDRAGIAVRALRFVPTRNGDG